MWSLCVPCMYNDFMLPLLAEVRQAPGLRDRVIRRVPNYLHLVLSPANPHSLNPQEQYFNSWNQPRIKFGPSCTTIILYSKDKYTLPSTGCPKSSLTSIFLSFGPLPLPCDRRDKFGCRFPLVKCAPWATRSFVSPRAISLATKGGRSLTLASS